MPDKANAKTVGLIVAADEPALFFSSPATAEAYLEAVDVRSGVYPEAYGPRGEPFDILVDRSDEVVVAERKACAPDPKRLREIVEGFLNACGISAPNDTPLDDLVALCAPYVNDGA